MLVMALLLVAISSEAASILYGGCVFISVSVHYFTLVAVMWMGAAALLMFQKVVLVFVHITATQFVIISLICWRKNAIIVFDHAVLYAIARLLVLLKWQYDLLLVVGT